MVSYSVGFLMYFGGQSNGGRNPRKRGDAKLESNVTMGCDVGLFYCDCSVAIWEILRPFFVWVNLKVHSEALEYKTKGDQL